MRKLRFFFSGGLGNQLFELGAYRHLERAGYELISDTSVLEYPLRSETRRVFALREFLPQPVESSRPRRYVLEALTRVPGGVRKESLAPGKLGWMYGYFQNSLAVHAVIGELTAAATKRMAASPVRARYQRRDVAAIHLRLGDYLSNPKTARLNGVVSDTYLQRAVRSMTERGVKEFVVFSDEPVAAVRQVERVTGVSAVSVTELLGGTQPADAEMFLLSCFANIVCSNSTFSFWGAAVNPCGSVKAVAVPRVWCRGVDAKPEFIPDGWMRL